MNLHADATLAARIEGYEALNGVECVEAVQRLRPERLATSLAVGSGWALFAGPVSPLTHAQGLGLPAAVASSDLDLVENFYLSRDAPVAIDVSPLSHPSLLDLLNQRRYQLSEYTQVLIRELSPQELTPFGSSVKVRLAEPGEDARWAETLARGFFERDDPSADELEIGLAIFQMAGSRCYFAEVAGESAGVGALSVREGIALLFGDAVLPRCRRHGAHRALIYARLMAAVLSGCTLASAGTLPGSGSQRNFQRCGFQVAYTKAVFTRR